MTAKIKQALSRARQEQLALILILIVLLLLITILSLFNYSTFDPQIGRYLDALQAGEYADAGRYFAEDIRGDLELERTAQGLVVRQIEDLKEDYVLQRISEEEMSASLIEMREAQLMTDSILIDLAEADMNVLTLSLKAYGAARQAELEGDISSAIRLYSEVQLLDPNFEEAQMRLGELRGRYIRQTEARIERMKRDALFAEGLTLIRESEALIPGERTWTELKTSLELARTEASKQTVLEQSLADRENMRYDLVLRRLAQAVEVYPDDVRFIEAYLETRSLVEDVYLKEAKEQFALGDKELALQTLKEGLTLVEASPYLLTWERLYLEQSAPEPINPVLPLPEGIE